MRTDLEAEAGTVEDLLKMPAAELDQIVMKVARSIAANGILLPTNVLLKNEGTGMVTTTTEVFGGKRHGEVREAVNASLGRLVDTGQLMLSIIDSAIPLRLGRGH